MGLNFFLVASTVIIFTCFSGTNAGNVIVLSLNVGIELVDPLIYVVNRDGNACYIPTDKRRY